MSYVHSTAVAGLTIVDKDEKNYILYYKRALSYLGLHRYSAAIADLDTVLAIQPEFSIALAQRGKLLAKQGDFANAIEDLKKTQTEPELVPNLYFNCRPYF